MENDLYQNLKTYYQTSEKYRDDLKTHDEVFLAPYIYLVEKYVSVPAQLLDLGCGTGLSTKMLNRRGYHSTGADLSPLFLREEKQTSPNLALISANAFELPFADHTFDAVAAFEFIEHIPDVPRLLEEVDRVLKPEGLLIFHSPNLISPYLPAFDVARMMLGGEGRPVFAETLPQAIGWLKSNLSKSLAKYFSSSADFIYRDPDLSEARIGGDADSVYLSNPIDLTRYLKQRGYAVHQKAHAMSWKNKLVARMTPSFAPYIGVVAQKQ